MKRFEINSLGCKVNSYEAQAIREMLIQNGYVEAKDDEEKDLVIINTCAVTSVAGHKSRQFVNRAKKNNPSAIIVALSCYAQIESNSLNADIIIGTNDKTKLIEKIKEFEQKKEKEVLIDKSRLRKTYENIKITSYSEKTRAFVKIQDGCDNFCSYCIIPYTRGKSLSRDRNEILNEVHNLVLNGYKEIVITGVDLASYGKTNNDSFVNLLRDILKQEKDLKRLRISSIEASQIDQDFIDLLKNEPRIASHLHIPLQSGSNNVLKRMNRKYTQDEFYEKIKMIKDVNKDIALACDVIVGFPEESEEEFKECVTFIDKCGFDFLHVFPYSIRKNTPAAKMKQVPYEIKKQRTRILINHGKELERAYYKRFNNQILEVLFETCEKDGVTYKGYSSNYLEVKVKSNKNLHNKMYKVLFKVNGESKLIEEL